MLVLAINQVENQQNEIKTVLECIYQFLQFFFLQNLQNLYRMSFLYLTVGYYKF
jgi:hypothetical protein